MAGKGRPGPKPKPPEERLEKTGVALRQGDIRTLQLLALELHSKATVAAIISAGDAPRVKMPPGPSVSSAIRYLIDRERSRRIEDWREMTRRGEHPALPNVK